MPTGQLKEKLAMENIFSTALVASLIAVVPAGAALADPGLPNARRHQHVIVTPNDNQVAVGPDFCANPDLQNAFNQFHFNVHHSEIRVAGQPVAIETLGPQHGAPGLHDDQGAEMEARPC
jgi:hypothetical protein